jgi:hypothetical protein
VEIRGSNPLGVALLYNTGRQVIPDTKQKSEFEYLFQIMLSRVLFLKSANTNPV